MAIGFPPAPFSQAREYHPSSRLVVPFGSPGFSPSLGSPVGRSVPRPVASARFSSRHLVRLSFSIVIPCRVRSIHGGGNDDGGGTVGNGDGGVAVFFFIVRRFPKLIIVRHGIMVLIIWGV